MIWLSNESQWAAILNESMADQLSDYLESKESQLSSQIVNSILLFEGMPLLTDTKTSFPLRLSEAVEECGKKIHRALQSPHLRMTSQQWSGVIKQINQALWNYVEVLEGCVTELFQQIDQMGFEYWTIDLVRALTSMKDELTHRLDDVIWAIRRLEQQLKGLLRSSESKEGVSLTSHKILFFWGTILDRLLLSTVRKCNKFLNFRYSKFIDRYSGYLQLLEQAQQPLHLFYHHRVLSSLDIDKQDKFKNLVLLLDLWDLNRSAKVVDRTEPVRALRSAITPEWIIVLLKDYLQAIRKAVFDKSRMIKKQFRHVFTDRQARQPLIDNLSNYRLELQLLNETAIKYRRFHLHTDPQSRHWIRSFFTKKKEGSEQRQIKELKQLLHENKRLDTMVVDLQSSFEKDSSHQKRLTPQLKDEVERYLHEMGQPLASMQLMQNNGRSLLVALHSLDEVGTFDPQVVIFICYALRKAMCADWKYQVLQEMPLFHQLYEIHHQVRAVSEDRQQASRLAKFQRILAQLMDWIEKEETVRHTHEIALEINDIKAYLQDFFAHVQRLERKTGEGLEEIGEEHPVTKAANAQLHYLYLFGKFFKRLHSNDLEQRLLRRQMLFVDQYFEEIDRKLQELMPSI